MRPNAGVSAHSAEFTETAELPDPPGVTVTKSPWLIALFQTLYFAVPGMAFTPPSSRSKLTA